jgi:predicted amidohydrolase
MQTVFLAAVQSHLEMDAYRSLEAFSAWIEGQTARALEGREPNEGALVAFPELIGLPLLFHLERRTNATKTQDAAVELLRESWLEAARYGLRHAHLSLSNLVLPQAVRLHTTMLEAFSRAARQHRAFIVAGSSFLPTVDDEAAKGAHVADARVRNVSYLFAPSGRILSRSAKINLTAGMESALGLTRLRLEDLHAAVTPLGRVATLICYDAFFDTCLERADSLGAQILVQPSANAQKWNGPWSADPRAVEGEQWLARGVTARVQGRVNLRYAVNPMLVGTLFDLEFEGCSSISANTELTGHERALLEIAPRADEFAVVTARVPDVGVER